jgi:hypothetical protein
MAKEDVAFIAGNLLGVGKKVKEENPNAKQSRKTGRKVGSCPASGTEERQIRCRSDAVGTR